jgi:hypothetical protein
MATFSLTRVDVFPDGTSVGAYPAANWSQAQLPPSGAPQGSSTATATMTSGTASFTGLADGTRYYFGAQVSGTWRYVTGVSSPASAESRVLAADYGVSLLATAAVNKAAIDAAIAAAVAKATAFGTGVATVELPIGVILTTGGHSDGGANVCIIGHGPGRTYLQCTTAPVGDIFTLNGTRSRIEGLTIDGSRQGTTADCLVLNGGYTVARNVDLYNAGRNGLTLGKSGTAANGCVLEELRIRYCKAYGIQTVANGYCFDGRWNSIDIGQSGKSGVKLDSGGQNLVNVHVWGSGVESDQDGTDSSGFYLNSSHNNLSNCQSETNNSYGVLCNGVGNNWQGGSIWGNYLSAVAHGGSSQRMALAGAAIYDNVVKNTAGSSGSANAAVKNGSLYFSMVHCYIYDDAAAVAAGSYGWTPAFPFPGRGAQKTQGVAYAETGAYHSTIVGNTMRAEDTAASSWGFTNSDPRGVFENNYLGVAGINMPSVASAATITIPVEARNKALKVTGTTGITSIAAGRPGDRISLVFAASLTVTDGSNLKLAGNFSATADSTLRLLTDGTNWYEESRSLN